MAGEKDEKDPQSDRERGREVKTVKRRGKEVKRGGGGVVPSDSLQGNLITV